MLRFLAFIILGAGLGYPFMSPALELYVSPAGSDQNPGTRQQPLQTLAAAQKAVRARAGKEPVTVLFGEGTYYLPETVVFTPADSGAAHAPVVYRSPKEGGAVLSGGQKLTVRWEPFRDGIFRAQTPPGLAVDQLFINGRRQWMARYPNFDPKKTTAAFQGYAADAFAPSRAARWNDPTGGFIHAMHVARWGGYHFRITGKRPDGTVQYLGGWQNNRQMGIHREFRMVENIFEELDAPGEWYHDARAAVLYLMPEPGVDLATATVEVVRLRHLIEFQGSETAPVRHLTLQGFVFRHTARTFMDTREPLLRSDWTIYRGGALLLTGTEDVRLLDCEFDQPGGNAIFVNHYNRRVLIRGCHLHDTGASGVAFVGDPQAVRNPLFEYHQTNDLTQIDRTPGPKTANYPADCVVEDCLIHGIGRVERQVAGVQISMAQRITVRDTSIYDCARAGINISEGTWGGHLLERLDVFDTVLETDDHGSFNSWGRDRYWHPNHRGVSGPAVKADPRLPFLDAMNTTTIRDSRWRCDHGWDIDLDDGSSNYDIHHNLLLAGGLKFREGFRRRAWNNILINNGFHPHVWFDDSDDEFFHNIVMAPARGIGAPTPTARGRRIDDNFFYVANAADRDRYARFDWDRHSVVGDPLFVDPARGDFRVRDHSPALALGFRNFPMDQFGVKKPALKALARQPQIPPLKTTAPASHAPLSAPPARYWLGAKLHGLEGEEYSAFGIRREDGGVQLVDLPPDSAAAQAGLRANDLLQELNERKIRNETDLFAALIHEADAPLTVRLVRHQQAMTLALPHTPFLLVRTGHTADELKPLALPSQPAGTVTANQPTRNDPLAVLTDGALNQSYGPVFPNGVRDGAYMMDLGAVKTITAITCWTFNQNGNRGRQRVTLYGSAAKSHPGWKWEDATVFKVLGTLDTASVTSRTFTAASLRASPGQSLGAFRWIVWQPAPVSALGENSAFQELAVESAP